MVAAHKSNMALAAMLLVVVGCENKPQQAVVQTPAAVKTPAAPLPIPTRNAKPVREPPSGALVPRRWEHITSQEYGNAWPFTVGEGDIECVDRLGSVIFRAPDGQEYCLNGLAGNLGYPVPDDAIWRKDPDNEGLYISQERVRTRALALCPK